MHLLHFAKESNPRKTLEVSILMSISQIGKLACPSSNKDEIESELRFYGPESML